MRPWDHRQPRPPSKNSVPSVLTGCFGSTRCSCVQQTKDRRSFTSARPADTSGLSITKNTLPVEQQR
jgi:hypothetical protein